MSGRVLVTGASGFIGRVLCNTLVSKGYRVVGLGRLRVTSFCDGVDYRTCDLRIGDLTAIASDGFDAVVHLAGLAHGRDDGPTRNEELRGTNVDVTVKVAEAVIRARVSRFIFVSSIGVHGTSTSGAPITENSPLAPGSAYAQSKLDAETALTTVFRDMGGSGLVVVRPPLVYGAGAPGNFQRLLKLTALRWPLPFGGCDNRRSMISVSNLVRFLMVCIDRPQAVDQTFVVSDGETVSTKQIVTSLRYGMKRRGTLFSVPPFIMRTALALTGKLDMYQQLFGDLEVDSRKAEQLLGWVPDRNTLKQLEAVGACYVDSCL